MQAYHIWCRELTASHDAIKLNRESSSDKEFTMSQIVKIFSILALTFAFVSGCSIRHDIQEDYDQYLVNNAGTSDLPQSTKASDYFLPEQTMAFSYEFRAVTTGYANLWVVDIGEMLDDTMQSADVQKAFQGLNKVPTESEESEGLLVFKLEDYTFEDYGAHIKLNISLSSNGNQVFSKSYQEDGKTQGGKMFWAGAFGQKNAVQQSTKLAIDAILRRLIEDLNALKDQYSSLTQR